MLSEIDTDAASDFEVISKGDTNVIFLSLLAHMFDVATNIGVLVFALCLGYWWITVTILGTFFVTGVVSAIYLKNAGQGWKSCLLAVLQVQVALEACRFLKTRSEGHFHALRFFQAIVQAAPISFVQCWALLIAQAPEESSFQDFLWISLSVSFLSTAIGLAFWEQKVSHGFFSSYSQYLWMVFVLRFCEIVVRAITLALIAVHISPFICGLFIFVDYMVLMGMLAGHKAVQGVYGILLAFPLIFMSVEPLIWSRNDHAVPKEIYYPLRAAEFCLAWIWFLIISWGSAYSADAAALQKVSWFCAALFAVMAPMVWRMARMNEVSRDSDNAMQLWDRITPFSESDEYSSA